VIAVLTGGTGGAKFVDGLRHVVSPEELAIIVNTGDDHEWWGLYVSPDVDSIVYVLANMLSAERGWGVRDETFHCLEAMKYLGEPAWFSVGDRDLAMHLLRSRLIAEGQTLSQATSYIAQQLGLRSRILPMSDMRVETRIDTPAGDLSFEEYFVKRRYQDRVHSVRFVGVSEARPGPGVVETISAAEAVLIAPSNPVTSIGPILAIPGIRQALQATPAMVVAVSPIMGNHAVSGPAANLMMARGLPASIAGVAQAYDGFLDTMIVDNSDSAAAMSFADHRLQLHCTNILMRSAEDKIRLARTALELACPNLSQSVAEAK
jgi:LPPG:FO 2-phospho-L-lactate transferase